MRTTTTAIVVVCVIAIAGYVCFRILFGRRSSTHNLIALVFLLDAPRKMSEQDVRRSAAAAFGVTFDEGNPEAREFVIAFPGAPVKGIEKGTAQSFMVKVGQGVFLVNNFTVPYMERPDKFAESIPDKRLRKAIASHRAWISVDAIGDVSTREGKAEAYRGIGKMIGQLAGTDCLALYCPELERCNESDESLLTKLRSNDPLALFQTPTFAPVISVDGDDPRMVKAVAEAQRRWPEFVAAFRAKRDEDKPFIIKAEFEEADKAEFMWVSVNRIEGDTIHGVLENRPHQLTRVKEGQQVAVPVSALNDWLYIKGKESVGGFTMKVIAEAQKEE